MNLTTDTPYTGHVTVTTDSGDDTVTTETEKVSFNRLTIDTGSGSDKITTLIEDGLTEIDSGAGDDSVIAIGGVLVISTQSGDDTLSATGNSISCVALGSGTDKLVYNLSDEGLAVVSPDDGQCDYIDGEFPFLTDVAEDDGDTDEIWSCPEFTMFYLNSAWSSTAYFLGTEVEDDPTLLEEDNFHASDTFCAD